ncbi:MAG: HNH endonuclease [Chloroflexi bacterium]|nr:HNH endonuclease [Chloroflexota bacterium]MBI3733355.1 HNH endonuclease [Chloroflexota bacterium]
MDGSVLVLNATYEPLNVVSVRRAIVLLLKEKAEVVEAAQARLRAESTSFQYPLVIRLVAYVKVPRQLSLPLTRRTVLARDQYTCQYCGTQPGKNNLTVDHVIPRSKGGLTLWENVVAACGGCNQRKGNRTVHEAGMALHSKPARPRYIAIAFIGHSNAPTVWHKYLQSA